MSDKSVPGFIQLGFSPCYLCAPYYQFLFFLASSAKPTSDRPKSQAFLAFNNEFNRGIAGKFDYTIDAGEPAKFRVQTFPKRYGFIQLTAEYFPNKTPWNPVTVLNYTTKAADNLFPSPITYAVFGDDLTNYFTGSIPDNTKAATYSFRDGETINCIYVPPMPMFLFQLTDYHNTSPLLTAERDTTLALRLLIAIAL